MNKFLLLIFRYKYEQLNTFILGFHSNLLWMSAWLNFEIYAINYSQYFFYLDFHSFVNPAFVIDGNKSDNLKSKIKTLIGECSSQLSWCVNLVLMHFHLW